MCTKGKKVKASEAALLKKLNFKPFEYGMKVLSVYDEGSILPEEVLNLDPNTLLGKFSEGARNIVGLSLESGYLISATIPLMITNAFKNIAALSLESGYILIYLDSKFHKLKLLQVDLLLKLPKKPRKKKRKKHLKKKLLLPLLRKKKWTWVTSLADRI